MKLSQLLTRLMETEEFSELRRSVAAMPLVRARLIEAATPALLAAIHEDGAPILVVAPFDDAAELLAGDLREWYGHPEDIATFADPQGSPYERVADSAERVRERLRAVALLTAGRGIVVVSQRGLMHPTETGEEFGRFRRIIERGTSAGPAALAGWLIDAGFVREPAVERSGVSPTAVGSSTSTLLSRISRQGLSSSATKSTRSVHLTRILSDRPARWTATS